MKQATDKCFSVDVLLSKTINEYVALYKRIIQMGLINNDQLLATYLINSLNDISSFETLQSNIITSADDSTFLSKTIIHHILQQDNLSRRRAEQNSQTVSAFVAQTHGKPKIFCTHCKKSSHLTEFCIQPGGKMAGRSIDDTQAA